MLSRIPSRIVAAVALVFLLPPVTMVLPRYGAAVHALVNLAVVGWAAREHERYRRRSTGRERRLRGFGVVAMVPWGAYWTVRTVQLTTDGSTARPVAALTIPALGALLIGMLVLLAGPDAPATLTGKLRMALDGGIIALSSAGIAWLLILRPAVDQAHVEGASGFALIALAGALIAVGSVGLLLAFGSESLRWTIVESVSLGIALLAFSTFGTMVLRLHGVTDAFTVVGGLTALGGVFIGYAARLPVPEGGRKLWNPLSTSAQLLPFAPVVALIGAAAYCWFRGVHVDPPLVVLAFGVVVALLARQVLALRLNTRLAAELSRQRTHLVHLAFHDPLTGLANRTLFVDRLTAALAPGRPRPALLLVDLDGFKAVNDTRGHPAGDQLLVAVAERLRICVGSADTVARLGGDEFAVLLHDGDAVRAAEVIFEMLAEPVVAGAGPPLAVRASIGIAVADDTTTAEHLQRDADMALYEAKQQGRNRYRVADEELSSSTLARLELEDDLRRGLDAGQFEVYYQPIVELSSGRVTAVEALLRWRHPTRGLLAPNAFLDVAEAAGLLPRLDQWVLHQACGQVACWRKLVPGFVVSVNVSAGNLSDPGLVDRVSSAAAGARVPAGALMVEVTETALVADLDLAAAALRELSALGVRIALDDFGTGYSSLTYLRTLPIHTLKIDRSFVRDLAGNPTDEAVTRAILGLAETLGLRPVAEGVEGPVQAERLRELRCGHAQGYLFGRPMAADSVTELLYEAEARPASA